MSTDRRSARSSMARILAARHNSPGNSTVVLTLSLAGRLGVTAHSLPQGRQNGNTVTHCGGKAAIRLCGDTGVLRS